MKGVFGSLSVREQTKAISSGRGVGGLVAAFRIRSKNKSKQSFGRGGGRQGRR